MIVKDNKRRDIKIANLNPMKKYDMSNYYLLNF